MAIEPKETLALPVSSWPSISIITPNFNLGEYLEETIKSVLDQKYPNLEYIIIDGGSKDNSPEIIKKYEDKLAYWISEPDRGLYHAIQKGFEKSTGEIMMWVNSDDKLHPGALFTVAEIFSSFKKVKWLTGALSTFDEKGRTVNVFPPRQWSKFHFYIGDYKWIQQESTAWRRSLWEEAGSYIDTKLKLAGDFELWIRFFRHARLYSTTGLIGGFRIRSRGQLSEDIQSYLQECEKILKKETSQLRTDVRNNIRLIKGYRKFSSFMQKFKIINVSAVDRKIFESQFDSPPLITFCREKQRYIIQG